MAEIVSFQSWTFFTHSQKCMFFLSSIWRWIIAESGHFSILKIFFFYFILFILLFKSVKTKKVMPNGVHSAYWNDHKNSPNQKKENSKSAVKGMKRDAFLLSVVVPTKKNCNPIPPNIGWVWDSLKLPFDKISFDWNAHKEYWIYSRLSINRIIKWINDTPKIHYENMNFIFGNSSIRIMVPIPLS